VAALTVLLDLAGVFKVIASTRSKLSILSRANLLDVSNILVEVNRLSIGLRLVSVLNTSTATMILTNLTQTTTPKSSGHLSTLPLLIILTLSMDITVLILVRVKVLTYPPMNYLVVMDHHTVMDFLVDLSADI
jgi:hypothetical protein